MGRTTLKRLIDNYRTDPYSDFKKLKYQVRTKRDGELNRLLKEYGSTQLCNIRFRTLTAWYRDALADGKIAKANSLLSRLRELFRFGYLMLEDADCDRLCDDLGKLRLETAPPRRVQMTADHVRAICKTAREHFGWPSIGLVQALQFELLLVQKDVIGEWVPVAEPGNSDVVVGDRKWLRGLRWSDIDENLILRHKVGSGGRDIEVDLRTAPMVLELLKLVAAERNGPCPPMSEILHRLWEVLAKPPQRHDNAEPEPTVVALDELYGLLPHSGPMILCEINALPWTAAEFRRKWRLVAKKAGVPDNLTNRDSFLAGTVRGGPDRAEIRQAYTLKRLDYGGRMARRMSEDAPLSRHRRQARKLRE